MPLPIELIRDLPGTTAGSTFTGAFFNFGETHRYLLWRRWGIDSAPWLGWIMLNPSTADHCEDDPTIRRCIGWAKRWDPTEMPARWHERPAAFPVFGGIVVANAYSLRATDPAVMLRHPHRLGDVNDELVRRVIRRCAWTVVAWGDRVEPDRRRALAEIVGSSALCLGRTAGGQPRHPLRVAYVQPVEAWP
jgi:hypothetical protein